MDYKKLKTIVKMVDECDEVIERVKVADVSESMKAALMEGVIARRQSLIEQIEGPIVHEYV